MNFVCLFNFNKLCILFKVRFLFRTKEQLKFFQGPKTHFMEKWRKVLQGRWDNGRWNRIWQNILPSVPTPGFKNHKQVV